MAPLAAVPVPPGPTAAAVNQAVIGVPLVNISQTADHPIATIAHQAKRHPVALQVVMR